jgi:hypothetical protein
MDDRNKYVIEDSRITSIDFPPKSSDWQCHLFGSKRGLVYTPFEGQEPNWFHRKMQELILGFKWKKVK